MRFSAITIAATLLLTAASVTAEEVVLPHTFSNDTPALAEEVNENFGALRDAINAVQSSTTNTISSGNDNPTSELGNDGDFYLNIANATLFGPKLSGEWGEAVSLVGPLGPTGSTGPQGDIGPQGPQGDIGPIGLTGPQGNIGPQGPTGPTGAQGDTGPKGDGCSISPCTGSGSSGTATLSCENGSNVEIACIVPLTKYVFVTSDSYSGNLGGLSGADTKCQALAQAAGLDGTFKAWLSDSSGASPSTRFSNSTDAYVKVDGAVVANDYTDLVSGNLRSEINLDQNGNAVNDSYVWSNTKSDGTVQGSNPGTHSCNDWTASGSVYGFVSHTTRRSVSPDWSYEGNPSCDFPDVRLYCFEQ